MLTIKNKKQLLQEKFLDWIYFQAKLRGRGYNM